MKKILEQLYYGNLYPSENTHPSIDGYAEANQLATQAYEELESKLCPEMKALLEDFISENMHLCSLDETQAFIEGFNQVVCGDLFTRIKCLTNRNRERGSQHRNAGNSFFNGIYPHDFV